MICLDLGSTSYLILTLCVHLTMCISGRISAEVSYNHFHK